MVYISAENTSAAFTRWLLSRQLLVLWQDVLNRVVAGVGGFLAAVVLEAVKQFEAHPFSVDVAIRERLMELGIVREPVRVALPGEPNIQGRTPSPWPIR